MTGLPWYRCYPRDFNDGMMGLTLEERGAYVTILNVIYARGGPVEDDAGYFRALMGLSAKGWVKIRAALIVKRKLFEVNVDGVPSLMNRRAAEEIEETRKKSEKFSEAGSRGGRKTQAQKRENNSLGQATLEACLKPGSSDTDTEADVELEANASLSPAKPTTYPEPFEAAWKAYPHVRGRSSKPKALGYWRRLSPATRQALPSAVARYARDGREPRAECGAPAMDRWLKDARFEAWLSDEPDQPADGPADPAVVSWRQAHFAKTGEWKPAWGPKPESLAA